MHEDVVNMSLRTWPAKVGVTSRRASERTKPEPG
jgi:hypothetical protein